MLHLGMFVYPWDAAENPDRFIEDYEALGCNMIAINAVYHQCNVLAPKAGRVLERRRAGTSFAIHPEKYGRMVPRAEAELIGVYDRLRELCTQKGIDWRCWMVNLHNGEMGERYPDATVENVWGDRYVSSLCLNHPDVREYAGAILEDVIETLAPTRVIMETECWMQAFHGRHHEFSLARLTPAVQYLLSLCFCPQCMNAARDAGVDAEAARNVAKMLLARLLSADTTYEGSGDAQVLQLFLEYPELYAYQRFRMKSVNGLAGETARIAHSHNVLYEYIPSAAPFAINSMHYDASSFSALGDVVDGFVPLCYSPGETYPLIRRNVNLYAPYARVSLALNLGRARYAGQGDFAARVAEAAKDGVEDIYCYNYGLATEECLGWMQKAYRTAGVKGGGAE